MLKMNTHLDYEKHSQDNKDIENGYNGYTDENITRFFLMILKYSLNDRKSYFKLTHSKRYN